MSDIENPKTTLKSSSVEMTDEDFKRFSQFIRSKYGIDFSKKRQLISSRLSSTLKNGPYKDFKSYTDFLMNSGTDDDINKLLAKLTTNYTYFMRETNTLDYFKNKILPEIIEKHQRDKTLYIWSAGCASGEEPYQLSMIVKDVLGAQASSWDTRILATDLSTAALGRAQQGIYELPDNMPEKWVKDYFKHIEGDRYQVADVIRDNVIYKQFNLMNPIQFKKKFDVIFCRNVMIYFDQETKKALTERLYDATVPGGYLIISMSENITTDSAYNRVSNAVYQK